MSVCDVSPKADHLAKPSHGKYKPLVVLDSTYEIVLGADGEVSRRRILESLGLEELNRRIVSLPGFADDPAWVNDAILKGILRDWYEEIAV